MKCKRCGSESIYTGTVYSEHDGEAIGVRFRCLHCGNEHTMFFNNLNEPKEVERHFEGADEK